MNSGLGFGPQPMSRYSRPRSRASRACQARLRSTREMPMRATRFTRRSRALSKALPTRAPVPAATAGDVSGAGRGAVPSRVGELGPVLGVALRVLPHHAAVDRVALHEPTEARGLVRAVQQDAPRRAAAQAVPGELCGGVADREPDR